jgi:N-acetylglucosamine malate deacetylase 1
MFQGIERALVVAAHPDDEVLGCGATVARLTASGVRVRALILATGGLSRADGSQDDVNDLKAAAMTAAVTLGVEEVIFGNLPDNAMDTVSLLEVVQLVESNVQNFKPQLLMTHHAGDLNIDHRIAHEAVLTACRPLAGNPVQTILTFETVSSTEWQSTALPAFRPTVFVECGPALEIKMTALGHYKMEMQESPHPRSVEQVRELAHLRGRANGFDAAEAFDVVRHTLVI